MTVCIGIIHDEKVSLHSLESKSGLGKCQASCAMWPKLFLKLHGYCQNAVKDFPRLLRLFMGLLFEI